jgi:Flp pilus assembly pilin Flp
VSKLIDFLRAQINHEAGQAVVEYGLILGLVSLAAIIGLTAMAGGVGGLYDTMVRLTEAMADALAGA